MTFHEEELVQLAQSGDPAALEQISKSYEQRIYQVVLRILRHHHDAEDVTQQALAAMALCLGQYRQEARFSTWVMHIAHNLSLKALRKRQRQPALLFSDREPDRCRASLDQAVEWRTNPEVLASQQEGWRLLEEALKRCGEKYRLVFQLRQLEGWSTRRVAEALELTKGAVKVRLHRARVLLRAHLRASLGSLSQG